MHALRCWSDHRWKSYFWPLLCDLWNRLLFGGTIWPLSSAIPTTTATVTFSMAVIVSLAYFLVSLCIVIAFPPSLNCCSWASETFGISINLKLCVCSTNTHPPTHTHTHTLRVIPQIAFRFIWGLLSSQLSLHSSLSGRQSLVWSYTTKI